MLHIGCHLSSSKGFLAMGRQALELGADTFQFFTRNPRGSKAKELDPADAAALVALMKDHCFAPIIAHAGSRARNANLPLMKTCRKAGLSCIRYTPKAAGAIRASPL